MKRCTGCGIEKSLENFSKRSASSDGLSYRCKPCHNYVNKLWIDRNPERVAAGKAKYSAANPERMAASKVRYNAAHKDRIAAYGAKYKLLNREKARVYRLAYDAKNKEKINERARVYREFNRGKCNSWVSCRRAAKIKATPSWADEFIVSEFYELAALRAKLTGVKWHVDHIVPLVSDLVCGLHCESNLQLLTQFDNISKGNRRWPDMPTQEQVI